MKKLFLFIILILYSLAANAAVRNVPSQYATIQSAINASVNGDTVLVDQGTYYENINFYGKKIVVTSKFYITNNLSYIQNTVINGSTPSNPDSASCVRFHSGEDSTTVLQGFTITGGTGTKWLDEHGAGVYREGGGILIAFCAPVIQNNIIRNNEALNFLNANGAGGGGLRIGDGNPKILNNIITSNKALYGAGIVLNYTGVLLKNNLICFNSQSSTYSAGAGIWANNVLAGKPRLIENNTIIHNSSTIGTAGVLSIYSSNLILRNNIVWGNTSPGGSQILASNGGVVTVSYCCVQGGYTGTGNISLYPLFADTNFILADSSPCIDAGDTSSVFNDPANPGNPLLAKFPAKGGIRCDMGAYGGPRSSLLAGTTVIGIRNSNSIEPEGFQLYQNYPNPFNPSTNIKYVLARNGHVTLKVYDILGKKIATLVNEFEKAGTHEKYFYANNLSTGIYIFKLTSDGFSEEKKMMLIK